VSWSELETIWLGFWNAPETRWVVLDAYIWVPLKLEPHRRKFAEIARARGLEIAPLDEGEHADLLRECANPLDAAEVADELESFLKDKDPAAWEWDEFIHQPQSDPRVEAMRQRCVGLDLSTAEGREILREELRRLRSDEERGG
jgi:hypothetical protein